MAEEIELNSFITKFKQLWRSGFSAHLDVDSCDGKAWVGIRLNLGGAPDRVHVRHHGEDVQISRVSPSKERRRERRAAMREVVKETAPAVEEIAEVEEHLETNEQVNNDAMIDKTEISEEETT